MKKTAEESAKETINQLQQKREGCAKKKALEIVDLFLINYDFLCNIANYFIALFIIILRC